MFDRIIHARFGPILSALVLSLVSTPLVAMSIAGATVSPYPATSFEPFYELPPPLDQPQAIPIALVAVLAAGLVGGAVGGAVVRRSPVAGLLLALVVAWAAAIATLPIMPTISGLQFSAGYSCIDSCSAAIRDGQLLSGLAGYAGSLVGGTIEGSIVLALIAAVGAAYSAERRRPLLTAAFGLAAFGLLNLVSIQQGGLDAFLCLVVGALVWVAPYWVRWQRVQPRTTPAPQTSAVGASDPASGPPAPLGQP